jgi:hypothetical protein
LGRYLTRDAKSGGDISVKFVFELQCGQVKVIAWSNSSLELAPIINIYYKLIRQN